MDPNEMISHLEAENKDLKDRLRQASQLLQAMELDTQRKECVFEIINNLLSASGEVIAKAQDIIEVWEALGRPGGSELGGHILTLAARLEEFTNTDTPRYHENLEKVERLMPVNGRPASNNS